jgi:hypothetical protein
MISITGGGLTIIVECENIPMHNWMSFVSWYSIIKNLPDAEAVIACKRGEITSSQYYLWPRRTKVKFFMYTDAYQYNRPNIIKIDPHVMALREYNADAVGPADVGSEELTTFVDYSSGFGKFVISEWINKGVGPFQEATNKFSVPDMSANAIKLLTIWQQSCGLYTALEGG